MHYCSYTTTYILGAVVTQQRIPYLSHCSARETFILPLRAAPISLFISEEAHISGVSLCAIYLKQYLPGTERYSEWYYSKSETDSKYHKFSTLMNFHVQT